jgi:hypothetical protein
MKCRSVIKGYVYHTIIFLQKSQVFHVEHRCRIRGQFKIHIKHLEKLQCTTLSYFTKATFRGVFVASLSEQFDQSCGCVETAPFEVNVSVNCVTDTHRKGAAPSGNRTRMSKAVNIKPEVRYILSQFHPPTILTHICLRSV